MIIECIKEGFALTNKNLQVVLVRIAATLISLFGIFLFLGIPLIAAILYMGLDIAAAKGLWPFLVSDPFAFISRYLGLIALFVFSILSYIVFSSMVFLYVLGGSLGVLRNAAVNVQYKFSLSSFFSEANQNFIRLWWMITLVSFVLAALIALFMLIAGIGTAAVHTLSGSSSAIVMFFTSFMILSGATLGAIVFFATLVFSVYSIVVCVIERKGAVDSMKRTIGFLHDRPAAFLYCVLLFVGAVAVNIIFFSLKVPISMVPLIGPAISVLVSLVSILFKGYISVAVWASLITYYIRCTNYPVYSAVYEI